MIIKGCTFWSLIGIFVQAVPLFQPFLCPVCRSAILDMIANSERAGLSDNAEDRFIEERPSVLYWRHNCEIKFVHFFPSPLVRRVATALFNEQDPSCRPSPGQASQVAKSVTTGNRLAGTTILSRRQVPDAQGSALRAYAFDLCGFLRGRQSGFYCGWSCQARPAAVRGALSPAAGVPPGRCGAGSSKAKSHLRPRHGRTFWRS